MFVIRERLYAHPVFLLYLHIMIIVIIIIIIIIIIIVIYYCGDKKT